MFNFFMSGKKKELIEKFGECLAGSGIGDPLFYYTKYLSVDKVTVYHDKYRVSAYYAEKPADFKDSDEIEVLYFANYEFTEKRLYVYYIFSFSPIPYKAFGKTVKMYENGVKKYLSDFDVRGEEGICDILLSNALLGDARGRKIEEALSEEFNICISKYYDIKPSWVDCIRLLSGFGEKLMKSGAVQFMRKEKKDLVDQILIQFFKK